MALNNSHFNIPHDCVGQESGPSDYSALHALNRGHSLVFTCMLAGVESTRRCALLSVSFPGMAGRLGEKLTRVPTHGSSSMVASRRSDFLIGAQK